MAAQKAKPSGLQVDEDRGWQEKFWTAQRIAWVLMALFIVAALAGLTGNGGPFASGTVTTPAGSIDYPRITRWHSDEQVTLRLPQSAAGEVDLILSPQFAESFRINSIVPEPSSAQATGAGQRFTFDVGAGGGAKTIRFDVTTGNPALALPVDVKIGDSPPQRLTVTVLP